ncbi:Rha family transcriptional regulator, partial [Acinetobacter baumannii]
MNMMSVLNLRAVVTQENGEVKTTSYAVAEAFDKLHKNVIRG